MRDLILKAAADLNADLVGFAPASRFDSDDVLFQIMPDVKTVIGLGFRVLRGTYRGIEEGSTYYQYTTMAVESLEEVIMPTAMMGVCAILTDHGCTALPQRRHQTVMAEPDGMNPEVSHSAIYRGKTRENQLDFLSAAVKCGWGERGFHGALLTDAFGPMLRYCFVLTDVELEPSAMYEPHLCDRCGQCAAACPGGAIDRYGTVDPWQCAVYYNGANGATNPFMPPDAFQDMEDRLAIIAGEARVTPDTARRILDHIYFYPPAMHSYPCSICGRACDVACYIHLEEMGVLSRQFKTPFRKREKWRLDTDVFKGCKSG